MQRRIFIQITNLVFSFSFFCLQSNATDHSAPDRRIIIVKMGIVDQRISSNWKAALKSRMSQEEIDSMENIQRNLTNEEYEWRDLIASKAAEWNTWRDSLAVPFQKIFLPDTIYVILGFLGDDDAFTFEKQTVCLDLTALSRVYGKAALAENSSRINRIFCHEYTHLLHKEWARRNGYSTKTFLDEILWECLYEGIGMYRSLNPVWLPVNDSLPTQTQTALSELYPIFTDRLVTIKTNNSLSDSEKQRLHSNLSRGNVNKKWGAFPVAIWLSLEAKGDEKKLAKWIDRGPIAVIELAEKYLPGEYKNKLLAMF